VIRALTIRQPWAAAIAHGDKRIENRTWPTQYRGPLLIHAGAAPDPSPGPLAAAAVRGRPVDRRAVVAVARLTDCHQDDGPCTRWSEPHAWHWVLDEVTPLPVPVVCPGARKLWTPPTDLVDLVCEQLPRDVALRLMAAHQSHN
jgi:hypothetical protein